MTVFQAKDGLRFICLATPMHLHDRAGKLVFYYIKLKSRPSVCPSDHHVDNSVDSAWIDLKLDVCTAVVSGMCMVVLIIS